MREPVLAAARGTQPGRRSCRLGFTCWGFCISSTALSGAFITVPAKPSIFKETAAARLQSSLDAGSSISPSVALNVKLWLGPSPFLFQGMDLALIMYMLK